MIDSTVKKTFQEQGYYVFKNAFKLQTDYTIAQNITTKKTNGIWHFQMQFSF